jgi:hypothetical protein
VRYGAHNGNEYKVDISKMIQAKVGSGSRRAVLREVVDGHGVVWSFDARRRGEQSGRGAVYMQYPNEVCAVLEHLYRNQCTASQAAQQDPSSAAAQEAAVKNLNSAGLRAVFGFDLQESSAGSMSSSEDSDHGPHIPTNAIIETTNSTEEKTSGKSRRHKLKNARRLALRVGPGTPVLSEALFERALQSQWPAEEIAFAIRWLLRRGMNFAAVHCRRVALLHGSLRVLRVLLVEARVDVGGLEILCDAPAAATRGKKVSAGSSDGNGGWVQRCKLAVKALLARGATMGGTGTRSKLLRRLEEDGLTLLRARALATLCDELPDELLGHIGDFAGISAPFAWRDFHWVAQQSETA